jgi:hypothetical protein
MLSHLVEVLTLNRRLKHRVLNSGSRIAVSSQNLFVIQDIVTP